jgi:antirestriction protein
MLSVRELVQKEIEKENRIPIKACITNAGKYGEGELTGVWHRFPTTPEALAQTLERIGVDFNRYEEWFITDYETSIKGIRISEFESLDSLNYLASKIDGLEEWDVEHLQAALQYDLGFNVTDTINLLEESNLECYNVIYDIDNEYDLGYYIVEESGKFNTDNMGKLSGYLDYESYGRDVSINDGGRFTDKGYVCYSGGVTLEFDGKDVPEEYRVTSRARKIVIEKAKEKARESPAPKKSITARIEAHEAAKKAQEKTEPTTQKSKTNNIDL